MYETEGGYGVEPAKGKGREFQMFPEPVALEKSWQLSDGIGFSQKVVGDTLVVDFSGQDVNYFHAHKTFSPEPEASYRATGSIRTEGVSSTNGVCLEFNDAQASDRTKAAKASNDVVSTSNWQMVQVDYTSLPDSKKIDIRVRRMSGAGTRNRAGIYS